MSHKVVRNAQGVAVAFGPNDDNYDPRPPAGGRVVIEQSIPTLPAHVPQKVTMRQARLALLHAGKLQSVVNAIDSMQGIEGETARIEWNYSNEVIRTQPLTIAIAQAIGMTSEEMDALFINGAKL